MTLKEERDAQFEGKIGKIERARTRDPWFDLPFRGIALCGGQWIDLRQHPDGTVSGRPIPNGIGVCVFCLGWRPADSEEPCEDPPQTDRHRGDNNPSRWYESTCYFGGGGGALIETYAPSTAPLNLYWVETDDHDEDWFVVARNARQACSYHEDYEGYARRDATATLVARVPTHWLCHGVGHPPHDEAFLRDCGGKEVNYTPDPKTRGLRQQMGVVEGAWEFNGTIYTAGDIVANMAARRAAGTEVS